MTKKTRYFLAGSSAVLAAGVVSVGLVAFYGGGFPALVASSGPNELAYVPADAAVVAYADVRSIMTSELRQRFKQAVPLQEKGQQEFLEATGINLETDIDYVVAALAPGGSIQKTGVLVARGRFDDARLEALATQHGAQVQDYRGKRLLVVDHLKTHFEQHTSGDAENVSTTQNTGAMAFLEPGLIAIGDLAGVKRAIDASMSAQSITGNDEMMNLVNDVARSNTAWAVGRFDLIASHTKLPEQIARQMPPIKWFCAAGHINGGISALLRAEANDDQAAENLRGVVNGVISLARMQGGKDPKIASLVQSLQMSGSGTTVELSFNVPAEIFQMMAPKVQ